MDKKPFYITTPIYYINAAPHLGHAYTSVAADVLNRYLRKKGVVTRFATGTDEHGAKIERAAKTQGRSPAEYADEISEKFRALWKHLDIAYDDFIRTTEPRHVKTVQEAFSRLLKKGDVYPGSYKGYYCLSEETFWTPTEAPADSSGRRICPSPGCGRELELVEEESFFFKLSKYEKPLLEHYKDHPRFLSPAHRANEIVRFVESGLKDISVSRTKVSWGIPVPGSPGHTIYVWFDALFNYVSAAGGLENADGFWPADVHLVGKEIYRFHAVIWPALLMALGMPLPKRVFAHGWWTLKGEKMSKSKGNVFDAWELSRSFGTEALRYFLMREIPFGNDGEFSVEALHKRYNADLANDLGNLVSRVSEMVDRFISGRLPSGGGDAKPLILNGMTVSQINAAIDNSMENLDFSSALATVWAVIGDLNARINERAPWKTAKTDPQGTEEFLFESVRALRAVAGWIEPVMPHTAAKIQSQLGVRQFPQALTPQDVLAGAERGQGLIQKAPPLFPRKK